MGLTSFQTTSVRPLRASVRDYHPLPVFDSFHQLFRDNVQAKVHHHLRLARRNRRRQIGYFDGNVRRVMRRRILDTSEASEPFGVGRSPHSEIGAGAPP